MRVRLIEFGNHPMKKMTNNIIKAQSNKAPVEELKKQEQQSRSKNSNERVVIIIVEHKSTATISDYLLHLLAIPCRQ